MTRLYRWLITAFTLVAAAAMLSACGSDSSGSSATGSGSATAGGNSDSREVVMFIPSSSNNYIAEMIRTSREEFKKAGFSLKVFENNFDQSQENSQVEQFLASGDKPAGIVWFPADNKAGIASVRRLAQLGVPIVQTNQAVLPEAKDYVTAYAGEYDYGNGKTSGESAIKMRDQWIKEGKKLNSEAGNLVILSYPEGYQAGEDRIRGFTDATKAAPFNVVGTVVTGFTAEESYKAVSQAYAALKKKGVDFVYAVSEFPAMGGIQALEEAGRKPGQDVGVISGNCQTNFDLFVSGAEYATAIQSPNVEGETFAKVLVKLMQNGGKTQGPDTTEELPATAGEAPPIPDVPAYSTYMPNPPVIGGGTSKENQTAIDDATLWGQPANALCAK